MVSVMTRLFRWRSGLIGRRGGGTVVNWFLLDELSDAPSNGIETAIESCTIFRRDDRLQGGAQRLMVSLHALHHGCRVRRQHQLHRSAILGVRLTLQIADTFEPINQCRDASRSDSEFTRERLLGERAMMLQNPECVNAGLREFRPRERAVHVLLQERTHLEYPIQNCGVHPAMVADSYIM